MDTKKLRQKILDLAIRGKLIPQDSNDEPASVLIEKIRAEKERLIKEKKIKRDKNESYIYRSDKSYYEKFADGSIKCIDEEIPFEIPESWEWCRLDSLATFSGGKTPSTGNTEYWGGEVLWVTSKDMKSYDIYNTQIKLSKEGVSQMQIFPPLTILIVVRSGILRRTLPIAVLRKEATINQDLKAISLFISNLAEFFFFSLMAAEEKILTNYSKAGTTVESINFDELKTILIPIPPLQEQLKIVVSIKQCFELIDGIEQNQESLQFAVKQAKSKILDLAIRGKLVPQDPNDESASVLLERIKSEHLESKKKYKNISDNSHYRNLPFEIPENWAWARFQDVFEIVMGQSPNGECISIEGEYEFHQGKTHFGDRVLLPSQTFTSYPTKLAQPHSLLMCVRAPVGNINITNREICIGRGLCALKPLHKISPDFMYYWTSYFKDSFMSKATGTTFLAISGEMIKNEGIPIPPLKEQKRILYTIESIYKNMNAILNEL